MQILNSLANFTDADGLPLNSGYLYFGIPNLNPETNPTTVYWDAAFTQPAAQPIRTYGGYPIRNGIAAQLFINSDYSITVRNNKSELVYSNSSNSNSNTLYIGSGTGAQARTIGSKLSDTVSLNDYDTLKNALATGKRVLIPASVSSISVNNADSPFILPYADMIDAEGDLTLSLSAGVHTTTSGNIANIGQNENLTIEGIAPISTTLVSVASVSGVSGAYSVVLNLLDATGIVQDDFLKIDNAVPLMTLSGDNSVFRKRVAPNELLNCSANLGNITATNGGGSASWSSVGSGVLSEYISPGDLLTIKGQTREVNTVAVSSVTIIGAWTLGTTASRSYYLSRPNSGTVSTGGVSSVTVTGAVSSFLTEGNVGDLLLCDGVLSTITNIANNNTMTVSPAVTITAGTKYSIITPALAHEGCHRVTNVAGNQVTVENHWRGQFAPPVNKVSAGNVKAIKTVLKNTGSGDGLSFGQNSSLKWLNNLIVRGNNLSLTSIGLALNGRTAEGPTQIGPVGICNGGDGLGIVEWGTGALLGNGCILQTRKSHYNGNLAFGVYALEGSTSNLREVIVSGTNGRALQINANSTLLFTEGQACGNSSDGLTLETGTTVYAEIPFFWQNGGMGIRLNGACGFHVNEGVSGHSGASGLFAASGAQGECSRMLFVGNNRENLELIESSDVVANEMWATGCRGTTGTGRGVYASESSLLASGCAINGNSGGPAYFNGAGAVADMAQSFIRGTANNGIGAFATAKVVLSSGKIEAVSVDTGALMLVDGVSPTPTLTGVARLNEVSSKGALVKNDSSTDGFGVSLLRVAGGVVVDKLLRQITTINFGTVAANSSVTQTVTVTGAATDDQAFVSIANSSSLHPDGILIDAAVTAVNTVSVRAQNRTGAGIAVNNSFGICVIGFV